MKHIVIFGAGKSSTYLIQYLLGQLAGNNWHLTVLDADLDAAQSRVAGSSHAKGVSINVHVDDERKKWIASADIVISLLPPSLHFLVAADCLAFNKNLLTASYIDSRMEGLRGEISRKGLLFLCEMGLDPGIDHMSAMKLIHQLQRDGNRVTSFRSHCGGLVAPESDDNPWHYKVSWNPRNIVLAGKAGAVFKENNSQKTLDYEQLFDSGRVVDVPGLGLLSWYANRDSLAYINSYELGDIRTFVRTTLRHPEFCFGWKNIIQLRLTDETPTYDTDGMTLKQFFHQHLTQHGFSRWIENQLTSRLAQTRLLLEKLQQLLNAEQQVEESRMKELRDFMMVNNNGQLLDINLDQIKAKAAATVAGQMHEANLSMKQLVFLGMDDDITVINRGRCSAADVLQFALEKKLALMPEDRDMIVMMHEIGAETRSEKKSVISTLIVKGEDNIRTAMAKTVGLPLGIAAKLILQGRIRATGLRIPVIPEIYEPVLSELEEFGIGFQDAEVIS